MATTYTHTAFNDVAPKPQGTLGTISRSVEINWATLTNDATYQTVINDIVKVLKLPSGVKIKRVVLDNSLDLDSGGNTLDIDIILTDGTTSKTALNGGTAAGAAGIIDSDAASQYASGVDGINYVIPNGDFYLELKFIAAGTGDITAAAKSTVTVEYTPCLESGELVRDWPTPNP